MKLFDLDEQLSNVQRPSADRGNVIITIQPFNPQIVSSLNPARSAWPIGGWHDSEGVGVSSSSNALKPLRLSRGS